MLLSLRQKRSIGSDRRGWSGLRSGVDDLEVCDGLALNNPRLTSPAVLRAVNCYASIHLHRLP
jgi:hypothetical protein